MTEQSYGIKELLRNSTYQLQKSTILVALADSPSPSTVTPPLKGAPTKGTPTKATTTKATTTKATTTKETTTKETTTRGQHSGPEITAVGKLFGNRDQIHPHSVDSLAFSVFCINNPIPEVPTEEPLIEETVLTETLDEINPEFQNRIRAIQNDSELQAKVNFALDNWIGTRYCNYLNPRHI